MADADGGGLDAGAGQDGGGDDVGLQLVDTPTEQFKPVSACMLRYPERTAPL